MSEWFERYGYGEVHPRLIVGALMLDAGDVQVIAEHGVKRVLNLVEDREYPEGARLEVDIGLQANAMSERRIRSADFANLPATALAQAVDQVDAWLSEGHTVYLHCRAGWQRSATVAAGVIAVREGVGVDAALARLAARKPTAEPLPHQREDLRDWWRRRT